MLRNATECLRPGGYFIGTTTDACRLVYVVSPDALGLDILVLPKRPSWHYRLSSGVTHTARQCVDTKHASNLPPNRKKVRSVAGSSFGNDVFKVWPGAFVLLHVNCKGKWRL
jgi:hypothetical protein